MVITIARLSYSAPVEFLHKCQFSCPQVTFLEFLESLPEGIGGSKIQPTRISCLSANDPLLNAEEARGGVGVSVAGESNGWWGLKYGTQLTNTPLQF